MQDDEFQIGSKSGAQAFIGMLEELHLTDKSSQISEVSSEMVVSVLRSSKVFLPNSA